MSANDVIGLIILVAGLVFFPFVFLRARSMAERQASYLGSRGPKLVAVLAGINRAAAVVLLGGYVYLLVAYYVS